MLMLGSSEIGGGFVRLGFTDNGVRLKVGTKLTAEKINSWANKRTLIERGMIAVYPPAAFNGFSETNHVPIAHTTPPKRHVVSAGFGRFDVFEGLKVNDKALTKEEAEALAAQN